MSEKIKTDKMVAIRLLKTLAKGLTLKIGNEAIAMGEDGRVGCLREKKGTMIVIGDITIREFFELVEKHEVLPIVKEANL